MVQHQPFKHQRHCNRTVHLPFGIAHPHHRKSILTCRKSIIYHIGMNIILNYCQKSGTADTFLRHIQLHDPVDDQPTESTSD